MPRKETQTIVRQEVLPPEPETTTELAVITQESASVILLDSQKFDEFYDKIKGETDAFKPDLTTEKGRKAIASEAFRVTKVKTTIDKAAKQLTEQWRTQTNTVNAARKTMVERLDALSDEVRAPLTAYEEAEKAKGERRTAVMASIVELRQIAWDDDSAAIGERIDQLDALTISDDDWGDDIGTIINRVNEARETLAAARNKAVEAEQAAIELQRLRDAEVARLAEQAAKEAAEAEAKRLADEAAAAELAEAARIEKIKQDAIEAERLAAQLEQSAKDKAADDAAKEAKRIADVAIAEANERAAKFERDAQVERDRLAAIETERLAGAKRLADEQAKRDADIKHRTKCKTEAKEHLMSLGASEDVAVKIVLSLLAGEVPHTTWSF